jgi:hypothetical protein
MLEDGGLDLNLQRIIDELERERDRLTKAIDLLREGESASSSRKANAAQLDGEGPRTLRRRLTPAGRRRLSEAMKRRWAERKKKTKSPS